MKSVTPASARSSKAQQIQQCAILSLIFTGALVLTPRAMRTHAAEAASVAATNPAEKLFFAPRAVPAAETPAGFARAEKALPQQVIGNWDATETGAQEAVTSYVAFRPDGTYRYVYAVQQTGKCVVGTTTVEEGTASFQKDGTCVLSPAEGRYAGTTRGILVAREMGPSELGSRTLHWGWHQEGGKKQLYLGPDGSSAASFRAM